ncbi:unannotated protein [freshwater metagenome]|uniref:Unannotated protein n=1 Tax=freshwater metagenome TaxID=449393 RepID=A0A6J6XFC4_9ZZZZ|nr:GAF domain-containing protein [Actinomycetota bacterium]MSX32602.1 GAF domain-containing protein [Actinomycetota bacterium]MSX81891.1 GAF domain-containing protein [Actinomycetota bacterium]
MSAHTAPNDPTDNASSQNFAVNSAVGPASTSPERLNKLLGAFLAVAQDLSLSATLDRIVETSKDLAGAQYAALGVIAPDGTLSEFITSGIDAAGIAAIGAPPTGKGILGALILNPQPLRIADIETDERAFGLPPNHPPMHSFLGVPIVVRDRIFGNLYLTEKINGEQFTQEDKSLVVALAAAAGVAILNARLHSQVQELAIIEDRERIARDLHDTVIQRLFAAGMSLQSTSRMVDDAPAARILEAVDNLDRTIREIRGTIFALQHQQPTSLHAALRTLLAESRSSLGFLPELLTEGPIDTIVSPEIAENILATTREAISNIAQHAKASRAEVFVLAGSDVRLRITDNGVGVAPSDDAAESDLRGNGLRNMSARAESLGGKLALRRGPEGGTVLEWSAALSE